MINTFHLFARLKNLHDKCCDKKRMYEFEKQKFLTIDK